MPDHNRDHDGNLSRRIEELESLLAEQTGGEDTDPERQQVKIPILDEIVEPGAEPDNTPHHVQAPSPELNVLAARLERKFSRELDETVRILKDSLKESIIDELKSQLGEEEPQGDSPSYKDDRYEKSMGNDQD